VVAAAGLLGSENSSIFETLFSKKGISDHFTRTAGLTRFGLKISDPVKGETTDINFPGLNAVPDDVEALKKKLAALDSPWFVLAGSLPPGFPDSFYADLIQSLKARGKKVALDASGEALRLALAAKPDLIKPNVFELEAILGIPLSGKDQIMAAAKSLVERGIGTVVVSMGGQGACFANKSETFFAVPPGIQVLSTVGAGDAMVAGMVSAGLSGLSLADSAKLATGFSLDALTHPGPGLSSPQIVRQFAAEVRLQP
jgi:1-phosphofructokinase